MTDDKLPKNRPPTAEMQYRILAALLQIPSLYGRCRPFLSPDLFPLVSLSDIVAFANQIYDLHKETPSHTSLMDAFSLPAHETHRSAIDRAFTEQLDDTEYTVSRLASWARDRAVSQAIRDCILLENYRKTGDDNELPPRLKLHGKVTERSPVQIMEEACAVGKDISDMGDDIQDLIISSVDRVDSGEQIELFGLGLEHTDQAGVMIARGEVLGILGAEKSGKSFVCLTALFAALMNGHDAILYNIEIPQDREADRCANFVAGEKVDRRTDPAEYSKTVRARMGKLIKGRGKIVKRIADKVTFADIRSNLIAWKSEGFSPSLIIIDYVGLVRPAIVTGSSHVDDGRAMLEFRSLVAEFNAAGITPLQANRAGADEEVLRSKHIQGSNKIGQHVDAAISLSRSLEEIQEGTGRICVILARNAPAGTIINFTADFARARIVTTGIAVQEKKKEKPQKSSDSIEEAREAAKFRKANKNLKQKRAEEAEQQEELPDQG